MYIQFCNTNKSSSTCQISYRSISSTPKMKSHNIKSITQQQQSNIQYIYFYFRVYQQFVTLMRYSRKNVRLPILPHSSPPNNTLIQTPSPSSDFILYHLEGKKICIEAYKIQIEKIKLNTNLQVYQWRYQTQFPIVKTKYLTIQPTVTQLSNFIPVIVFNQHYPLKLNRIYQMTFAQTLYLLKQALIGFERLYNRFGAFKVTENMIGINEKGFCRVWINENFALNSFSKPQENQQKMVGTINEIMQKHCQQSKTSKNFFKKLKNCKTFLTSIKQIDSIILKDKVLVPTRYIMSSILKQLSPKFSTSLNITRKICKKQYGSDSSIRYSFNSVKFQKRKFKENIQDRDNPTIKICHDKIKRFKSQDKIRTDSIMKTSDGQTAYTLNIKCSSMGGNHCAPLKPPNIQKNNHFLQIPSDHRLEQSSFVIDSEDANNKYQINKNDKKQLSYSEALIGLHSSHQKQNTIKCRKFSVNINNGMEKFVYKFQNHVKKSQYQAYHSEFNEILDNKISAQPPQIRQIKPMQEIDQQKYSARHSENIMKNNGWNENAGIGFMNLHNQMKQSFHEGQQESLPKLQIKLLRLDTIGKRPVAMSILPQQHEDII